MGFLKDAFKSVKKFLKKDKIIDFGKKPKTFFDDKFGFLYSKHSTEFYKIGRDTSESDASDRLKDALEEREVIVELIDKNVTGNDKNDLNVIKDINNQPFFGESIDDFESYIEKLDPKHKRELDGLAANSPERAKKRKKMFFFALDAIAKERLDVLSKIYEEKTKQPFTEKEKKFFQKPKIEDKTTGRSGYTSSEKQEKGGRATNNTINNYYTIINQPKEGGGSGRTKTSYGHNAEYADIVDDEGKSHTPLPIGDGDKALSASSAKLLPKKFIKNNEK